MIIDRNIKKKIPYFFLLTLSFYPLMKAGIASISAILFLISTLLVYWHNFKLRYIDQGLKPLLANCGFYVLMLISILYSENLYTGFKAMQASLLLVFFPLVIFYFFPKIGQKTMEYVSYGFIIGNFILLLYFYNVLVEGLDIDRFSGLVDAGLFEQLRALNMYPYEFVLSKAQKHLDLVYESHKVYVSLHFLIAILLSINLIYNYQISIVKKLILIILSVLFSLAIVYTQAIATVLALILLVFALPLVYFNKTKGKLVYLSLMVLFGLFVWNSGMIEKYKNKNTDAIVKFFESFVEHSSSDTFEGIDKRIYIYACAFELIKQNMFLGYGVGDVQHKLNDCYSQNNYVISEYKAEGSDINTHNYYLNVWLASGLVGFLLFSIHVCA